MTILIAPLATRTGVFDNDARGHAHVRYGDPSDGDRHSDLHCTNDRTISVTLVAVIDTVAVGMVHGIDLS